MGFWDSSGISWTICKQSAHRSRQIMTPTPHHSIFTGQMFFLKPNQQCQSTKDNRYAKLSPIYPEKSRVKTEEVLQWYTEKKNPVVFVECQGSRASVPASAVPGHIWDSWGQLCCPSNVCMPEDGPDLS